MKYGFDTYTKHVIDTNTSTTLMSKILNTVSLRTHREKLF